jgi:hypothetical protein
MLRVSANANPTTNNNIQAAAVFVPMDVYSEEDKAWFKFFNFVSEVNVREFIFMVVVGGLTASITRNLSVQPWYGYGLNDGSAWSDRYPIGAPIVFPITTTGIGTTVTLVFRLFLARYGFSPNRLGLKVSSSADAGNDEAVSLNSFTFVDHVNADGGANVSTILGVSPLAKADIISTSGDGSAIVTNNGKVKALVPDSVNLKL